MRQQFCFVCLFVFSVEVSNVLREHCSIDFFLRSYSLGNLTPPAVNIILFSYFIFLDLTYLL